MSSWPGSPRPSTSFVGVKLLSKFVTPGPCPQAGCFRLGSSNRTQLGTAELLCIHVFCAFKTWMAGTSPAMTDEKPVTCAALRVAPYYLIVTGAGSGGTVVGWVPGTLDTWACGSGAAFGPGSGAAEAVVGDAGGEPPGSTTTRGPTFPP